MWSGLFFVILGRIGSSWNQIEAVYSKKNSYVSLLFCLIITSFMICFVKKCFCIAQDHGFTEF